MGKYLIMGLTVALFFVVATMPIFAATTKVTHTEFGAWNASYVVETSGSVIKTATSVKVKAIIGTIVNKQITVTKKHVILKITRRVGSFDFKVGMETTFSNGKLTTKAI